MNEWTNLKKIETDYNCGFLEILSAQNFVKVQLFVTFDIIHAWETNFVWHDAVILSFSASQFNAGSLLGVVLLVSPQKGFALMHG